MQVSAVTDEFWGPGQLGLVIQSFHALPSPWINLVVVVFPLHIYGEGRIYLDRDIEKPGRSDNSHEGTGLYVKVLHNVRRHLI